MGEIFDFFIYLYFFLKQCREQTPGRILTHKTQNRAKMCLFGL